MVIARPNASGATTQTGIILATIATVTQAKAHYLGGVLFQLLVWWLQSNRV